MADSSDSAAPAHGAATRRRYLTILFSDLSDSGKLAVAMEAEHYAELLAGLREAYVTVIPRHGGTVIRIQGDGILAIFGYPDTREDDGRRATEAALELHQKVGALQFDPPLPIRAPLALHTGIHSGLVLLDDGDLVRGRFDLVGDAPNVAARLSDVAESGEILVSADTLGPESHFFRTSERRDLGLKGRSETIAVYAVLDRLPVGNRFEVRSQRGLAPFVGRRRELRLLESQLDAVLSGVPGHVSIAAPAGLGKTRLIEEFLRRAATRDCQIHRGYCESCPTAEPLHPVLQMLRFLFRLEPGLSPSSAVERVESQLRAIDPALLRHRSELLRALALAPDGDADPRRPHAPPAAPALHDLFDRLAAAKPLVIFIDDWQWADDATRAIVDAIRGLEGRPVFVLTALRGPPADAGGLGDTHVLELPPLSDDEAAETIAHLLPRTDPFVRADIRRHAGGNPLYLEELCHAAAHDERRLGRQLGSAAWLHVMIESRVARLPPLQADLLRAAAVIGNVIPTWLIERVTGYAADHPLLRGLAEQDFIFPGERAQTLRFKHGIVRDVIYAAVGIRQRRQWHLRVAEALRQQGSIGAHDDRVELLAHHYGAGGRIEEAALYAERAGDKALAAAALDRAQTQYRAALAALDQLPASESIDRRWAGIAERFARVCVFDPSADQLALLYRAVDRAGSRHDGASQARAEHWLGYVHYVLGDARRAIEHCERALTVAGEGGDPALRAQIGASLGQARAAVGDYDMALPLLDGAIAVKQGQRSALRPAVGLAYTLCCKAAVLADRGLFEQAQACFDESMAAVSGADHEMQAAVLGWRSVTLLWQGRWDEALQAAAEAQAVAERVRSLFIFAADRAVGAYASWSLKRGPAALQVITSATAWLEAHDRRLNISLNYGWLTDALAASGRFDAMRRPAALATQRARRSDRLGLVMTYRALARASAAGHGTVPAAHYVDLALAAARARQSRHEVAATQLCDAQIRAANGERRRALDRLDEAEAGFDAMQMVWHLEQAEALRSTL